MSEFCYGVFLTQKDPGDPAALTLVGTRKTLAGAQRLGAKELGCRVYGWFRVGGAYEASKEKPGDAVPQKVRLEKGWW